MNAPLRLQPISYRLMTQGPLADQIKREYELAEMLDAHGFGFLTELPPKLIQATLTVKQEALRIFSDGNWPEVLSTWPRSKHGQLGPTGEGEEHYNESGGGKREASEKKRYISVDHEANGWYAKDEVRRLIPFIFRERYEMALKIASAYEAGRKLERGAVRSLLSLDHDSHTTMRINWYPSDGFSLDHTDTCSLTLLDFEEGVEIEHPHGSKRYVEITGARPGDLIINKGDILTKAIEGADVKSTRHRVRVHADRHRRGRVTIPTFFHPDTKAVFPDGQNIWQWATNKFHAEGAAADRA